MLELYRNIKKYRMANHMSQQELARLTGYTDRSSIAKIERGLVDLPQSKIVLFANALHVEPGDLMGEVVGDYMSNDDILMESIKMLNYAGRDRVLQYVSDLLDNQKYRR
jgi:transcriptional regulator with XRE-family HTH domain